MEAEVEALAAIQHPNVVKLIYVVWPAGTQSREACPAKAIAVVSTQGTRLLIAMELGDMTLATYITPVVANSMRALLYFSSASYVRAWQRCTINFTCTATSSPETSSYKSHTMDPCSKSQTLAVAGGHGLTKGFGKRCR